ncbi:MAG: hypothetical protein OEW15_01840 [Nitrospirota bacterium]|nr:hypothetical protein [Nitrospirota bacterium]
MTRQTFHIAVVIAALALFLWMDGSAKAARVFPARSAQGPLMVRVDSQKDIYVVYQRSGLWGARVVHLNRFLNLVDYLPREENVTMPFPVRVGDVRPLYEKGLDSHNWLFIANRTGMVRTVTVVLPAPVLRERLVQFEGDFAFSVSGEIVRGYTHDMPLTVTTLDAMPAIREPVIVNVDAGYFGFGEDPGRVLAGLREKCPDIRLIVVSGSRDEPEVVDGDRKRLRQFEKAWSSRG